MGQTYSKLDWAKRYRKIPKGVMHELDALEDGYFVVACTKEVIAEDLETERYGHLNILDESDVLEDWTSLIPAPNVGKTSYLNCEVSEVVNKQAGKVSKRFVSQAPDWKGDGMHETRYSKEVWARTLIPPIFTQVGFRRLDVPEEKRLLIHFEVHELFHPQMDDFELKLIRALNLLQENVGKIGISEVNETDRSRVGELNQFVRWNDMENFDSKEIMNSLSPNESERRIQAEKLNKLFEFTPHKIARGGGCFSAYLAIQYVDGFVVVGNFSSGSVLYAIRVDWKDMVQWSKDDLSRALSRSFERIRCKSGWYDKLRTLVLKERGELLDDQTLLDL